MAIVNNAAPVVNLPATGIDPTAAAAVAPVVAAPVVEAPVLSAHDQALVAEVQASVAARAAADPTGAVVPAVQAAPAVEVAQPQPEVAAAPPADVAQAADASVNGVPVELTASQKIAAKIEAKKTQVQKLLAEIEKLEGQFRSADLLDSIKAGSVIVARVGRAETAREVVASVVGVQTLESGDRRLKIYFGEGFDAETVVIQDSQIVDVKQV